MVRTKYQETGGIRNLGLSSRKIPVRSKFKPWSEKETSKH
jgi:hypothetical protein